MASPRRLCVPGSPVVTFGRESPAIRGAGDQARERPTLKRPSSGRFLRSLRIPHLRRVASRILTNLRECVPRRSLRRSSDPPWGKLLKKPPCATVDVAARRRGCEEGAKLSRKVIFGSFDSPGATKAERAVSTAWHWGYACAECAICWIFTRSCDSPWPEDTARVSDQVVWQSSRDDTLWCW